MHRVLFPVLCLAVFSSIPARADFGWIPEYKKLVTRLGIFYYKSDQNYATDGVLDPIKVGTRNTKLQDFITWLEAEYGIAQDWSVYVYVPFLSSSVNDFNTDAQVLTGNGFGDVRASIRWNVKSISPIVTLEALLKAPTGVSKPAKAGEMVLGDGNFDAGFKLQTGTKTGRLSLVLSPGFLFRSGGFSAAVIGDVAIQYAFPRGYVRLVGDAIYSLSDEKLGASSFKVQDQPGTGGSFARLNGSPIGFNGGGLVGFRIYDEFHVEAGLTLSVFGNHYPSFVQVRFNLLNTFDFFKPITPRKVRDVPFEEDDKDDFYKNK